MTAPTGQMLFLVNIVIILHLNIVSCSGSKYFLVEGKAKNASLVNHADDGHLSSIHRGTMASGLQSPRQRKIKKSRSETGQDYQQSMDTDGASPAPDRSMDGTLYYCRRAVNKPSQSFTVPVEGRSKSANKNLFYRVFGNIL